MAIPVRNTSGWVVGAEMIDVSTGANFSGTVTVYVTIDNGTQTIGAFNSGLAIDQGQGYYTYTPTVAETNGYLVSFTFTGTGAITATPEFPTLTAAQYAALSSATNTASITVADMITSSLRRINALQENESPSSALMQDSFQILNDWLESMQTERLTIPFIQRTTWTISSTKGTLASPYTVGLDGDVDVARPAFISDIRYQDTSVSPTYEYPLVSLTDAEWQAIPQKNLTSTLPVYAYYNPTYASNLGSLYLWMVPSNASLQGVLYAPAQIGAFASTATTIVLPPGYKRFIRENLAIELQPEVLQGVPIDPALQRSAIESKANIKRRNARSEDMITLSGPSIYNIYSDTNY